MSYFQQRAPEVTVWAYSFISHLCFLFVFPPKPLGHLQFHPLAWYHAIMEDTEEDTGSEILIEEILWII